MTELRHEYRNEAGELVLTVIRKRAPGQRSQFFRKPAGVPPEKVPLYRIDEWMPLARTRPITIVEGEADADALWAIGVPATTSGGSNSWLPHHTRALKRANAQVDIVADNDETGHRFAHQVKRELEDADIGVAAYTFGDDCKDMEEHLLAGHDYSDLVPLPARLGLPEIPHHPSDANMVAFDGPLGDLALAIAEHSQPNPEAILFAVYTGFGALLPEPGRYTPYGPTVKLGSGYQSTNLYVAMVAGPGVGKGQTWSPVGRALELADPKSSLRIFGHFGSGEFLIDFVSPIENKEGEMVDAGDPRLLYLAPELQGTLATMAREGSTLGAVLRQAWDRGSLDTGSRQHGKRQCRVNHLSLMGHITPADLGYMRPVDIANGFGSRFLLVMVKEARPMSILESVPEKIEGSWGAAMGKCLKAGRGIRRVTPDRSFAKVWDEYSSKCKAEEWPSPLDGLLARRPVQSLRLALIGAVAEGRDRLHEGDAERGIAMAEYAAESAKILFGPGGIVQASMQTPDATDVEYDRVLEALKSAGKEGLTQTAIRKEVLLRRGSGTNAKRTAALCNQLLMDGQVKWKDGKSGQGGRLVLA